MRNFRELSVWAKAHELAVVVYRGTCEFPKYEMYGLTSQIRRAASSIGANIAEGAGRGSDADFCRFLQISLGSANELHNHLLLAKDLGFLTEIDFVELEGRTREIQRMLAKFLAYLQPVAKDLRPNT
jgi:four helix bundle protein